MNTMEDKVRLALRETGEEIGPHSVPPLRLRGTRRHPPAPYPWPVGHLAHPAGRRGGGGRRGGRLAGHLCHVPRPRPEHRPGRGGAVERFPRRPPVGAPRGAAVLRGAAAAGPDLCPDRAGAVDRHRARPRDGQPAAALQGLHLGERHRGRPHVRARRPALVEHLPRAGRNARPGPGQQRADGLLQAGLRPGHRHGQAHQADRPGEDHRNEPRRGGGLPRRHQARPGLPPVHPDRHAGHRRGAHLDLAGHRVDRQLEARGPDLLLVLRRPLPGVPAVGRPPRHHARPHPGHHRPRHLADRGQGHRGVPVPVPGPTPTRPAIRSSPRTAPGSSPRPASSRGRAPRPAATSRSPGTPPAPASPLFHEDRFSSSVGWQEVLWASPDGSALVISDPRGAKTRYGGRNNVLGVLAGNKFTPIPHGADNGVFLAW